MIYGCLYRYINKNYLSRVLPLRGLVVVVHEVHLAGGGLSLLPARRKGTEHVVSVASSDIKTVLAQVRVWRVEGDVLQLWIALLYILYIIYVYHIIIILLSYHSIAILLHLTEDQYKRPIKIGILQFKILKFQTKSVR